MWSARPLKLRANVWAMRDAQNEFESNPLTRPCSRAARVFPSRVKVVRKTVSYSKSHAEGQSRILRYDKSVNSFRVTSMKDTSATKDCMRCSKLKKSYLLTNAWKSDLVGVPNLWFCQACEIVFCIHQSIKIDVSARFNKLNLNRSHLF